MPQTIGATDSDVEGLVDFARPALGLAKFFPVRLNLAAPRWNSLPTATARSAGKQEGKSMFVSRWSTIAAVAAVGIGLGAISPPPAQAQTYSITNLVSDGSVPAVTTDPSLINPWGISYAPGNPFWVSDNNSGVSTLYDGSGNKIPLTVNIPPPRGLTGLGTPTGQVFNSSPHVFRISSGGKIGKSVFIFDTEDGVIAGWSPSVDFANAVVAVDNSSEGAVYKGLAIGSVGGRYFLYAANFRAGDVEMFDGRFHLVRTLKDPTVPKDYSPFNTQVLGGNLYVTFAKTNKVRHDDVSGPGHGFVDVFGLDGSFKQRLVSHGALNSPWGLAIAPAGFGAFAGDLLVGNFGDGWINAYDPATGAYKGPLLDQNGAPIAIGDLWGLIVGGGGASGDPNTVYFAAGVSGEAHGLFGSLTLAAGGAGPAH